MTQPTTQSVNNAAMIVLGISEAEPGYTCVRVAPQPFGISNAGGSLEISAGIVSVQWRNEPARFTLETSVPVGIHLQVRLPAVPSDLLFIDDEPVAADTQVKRDDSYVELAVLPGSTYHFEVRKPNSDLAG